MIPLPRSPLVALVLVFVFIVGEAPRSHAQEDAAAPDLVSGPSAGSTLTAVACYATDGPLRGREFDAAARLGEAPCALLFIHELTRNTAPVLRGLDELATEFSLLGFKSFTVMLSGDRTAAEAQLQRVNGSLRLANPIVLSTDGAEGPGNYALNRKAALTVVFAKEGKVAKSLALTDTGPHDIPVLRAAIEEVAGKIPEDEGALRELVARSLPTDPEALRMLAAEQRLELRRLRERVAHLQQQARGGAMQRPAARPGAMRSDQRSGARQDRAAERPQPPVQREGKPPEDPELLSSLRSYIRKTNDKARVDEVFGEIEARAGVSAELHREVVEMFKLMLSIDYGSSYAQERARAFLKEAGPDSMDE